MTTSKSGQRKFLPWLLLAVSPAAAFLLVECFTHNPFIILTFPVALWNILFYELIYLFIYALTHSIGVSCLAGDVIFFVIGLANYYIVSFRSNPIVPWDIYSLRTAASVAGNFDYMPSPEAWLCIGGFAALLLMAVVLLWSKAGHKKQKKKKRKSTVRGGWKPAVLGRLFPAMLIVLTLCGYVKLLHQDAFVKALKLDNTLFTPFYMSRKDGFTTSFLMDLKYLKAEEPEGYDPAEEEALLAEIEEEEAVLTPNIIVVMDEAFSDPAILGEFKTNQDYMPFVHALQQGAENTQTGTLNVSVKGGNTANTEYELLTGHSMRFLPGGCVPYQQYIFGPRDSLVWWLDELGYQTTAIHPFNPSGWNRDKVYPWLGFDQALFNTSFINPERIANTLMMRPALIRLWKSTRTSRPAFRFSAWR
ncbi:MAG: LTA synthase family protein [Lachnospiraceae bacterium]|nr:LTA synthase family protein [Lachnospiraceae bacterium]